MAWSPCSNRSYGCAAPETEGLFLDYDHDKDLPVLVLLERE